MIAWRRGSVPEIVADGVSGIIVETMEEAVAAVGNVARLERRLVRRHFESSFTAARMADDYLVAYDRLLRAAGTAVPQLAAAE